jgi:hypothetical protein
MCCLQNNGSKCFSYETCYGNNKSAANVVLEKVQFPASEPLKLTLAI